MVPSTARSIGGLSPDTAKGPDAADRSVQQPTSLGCNRTITTSRLEVIRHRQQTKGISEEASQLLEARWSKGTNTTYQSAWKRWHGWCSRQEINPISCTVQPFLEFLTSLFKEGLRYRTINTIRSAISMTHDHIEGIPMGQHPLVTRLLKGVFTPTTTPLLSHMGCGCGHQILPVSGQK